MFQQTKTCGMCRHDLPLTEFAFKNKATGLLQSKCKECSRNYAKQHYAENTGVYLAKARSNNELYRQRNQDLVQQSLVGQACTACGTGEDLTYYNGGIENGQAVHMAVHAACSPDAVLDAIGRSVIVCRHCLSQHFGEKLEAWRSMSSPQRQAEQHKREVCGYKPVPKGVFKAYRPVERAQLVEFSAE